ncbi:aminoglycoside phosphotransferase family protein [Polaribacter aestuariivivens]|uniref:Aminoglycoside phosphotransferase family protein n=1 Tax=Polaribacter aestuariivivens TaxID=2304626 RepID=A0A5S3N9Q2_9FLAO|nr:phosphotransferase [Polaribacter aestuariivivens]TMM32011.1 aminoglycoside phosphotransferase family protein [Polaribacter aestuariivivens]
MGLKSQLQNIFEQFNVSEKFTDFQIFYSGHINNTYLILTKEKLNYVLQKINGNVFKKAKEVIENKVKVTSFLQNSNYKTLEYIKSKNGNFYIKDLENNYWNLCYYIKNSQTFTQVTSFKISFEAGKITGGFLTKMRDFEETLVDILPKFHNMSFRFLQFEEALKNASSKREETALEWINFCISKKEEMTILDKAILNKEIPLRVIHSDTKISNILFDKNEKAICLIDLDTVMKGVLHFDYGDALRTICNTAKEDEKNSKLINFNFNYFKNYTKGFLESTGNQLTKNELKYLSISPKIITFIMGLRFLTDYLNNDVYYKTEYKEHNLIRAKNQFILVNKILENQEKIENFIQKTTS